MRLLEGDIARHERAGNILEALRSAVSLGQLAVGMPHFTALEEIQDVLKRLLPDAEHQQPGFLQFETMASAWRLLQVLEAPQSADSAAAASSLGFPLPEYMSSAEFADLRSRDEGRRNSRLSADASSRRSLLNTSAPRPRRTGMRQRSDASDAQCRDSDDSCTNQNLINNRSNRGGEPFQAIKPRSASPGQRGNPNNILLQGQA
jgi:hypothetical protein